MKTLSLILVASLACAPAAVYAEVSVRWLGFAGFTITSRGTASGETTVAVDPFFSRPGLFATVFGDYEPDEGVLEPLLRVGSPAPELKDTAYYLIGHSHHDHLGDAPWLASHTHATILGSKTTASIAQTYKHTSNVVIDPGPVPEKAGAFDILLFHSPHAPLLGDWVIFKGTVDVPRRQPMHVSSFKLGGSRGHLVIERETSVRIAVLASPSCELANVDERFRPVDVLLAPVPRDSDKPYAQCLVRAFRPSLVIPHHFEDLFSSLDSGNEADPKHDERLGEFQRDLAQAAEATGSSPVEMRRLVLYGCLVVPTRAECLDQ
jgi:L-ascorbate metabolism protein UlaG (beta-lactamase superfamily)